MQIRLTNEQSGNERSMRTNDEGYFTIPNLRSGIYRINISKDGYSHRPSIISPSRPRSVRI